MRKSCGALAILILVLAGLALTGGACAKKKVASVPPPPPPPAPTKAPAPAPTITLNASPSTISSGQSSTLTWNSSNATSVTIDGGVGTVESSGSRTVSPSTSTTYTARASGPGGSANTSARVTVTEAATPPPRATTTADDVWFGTNVQDIFFDYDQYTIRDDARVTLMANARALAERPHIRFTIEGHCDERGSERYNLALGDKRANTAKEFLVAQRVSPDRVDALSFGEERPIDPGHDEAAWAKNRRAHFVLK